MKAVFLSISKTERGKSCTGHKIYFEILSATFVQILQLSSKYSTSQNGKEYEL